MNILEKYSNCCSVCKRFKPTLPKPAVGNLFDQDKIKFNQVVSIDLKQYRTNGLFISLMLSRDKFALPFLAIIVRKLL